MYLTFLFEFGFRFSIVCAAAFAAVASFIYRFRNLKQTLLFVQKFNRHFLVLNAKITKKKNEIKQSVFNIYNWLLF